MRSSMYTHTHIIVRDVAKVRSLNPREFLVDGGEMIKTKNEEKYTCLECIDTG